jgi:hypothetical protein
LAGVELGAVESLVLVLPLLPLSLEGVPDPDDLPESLPESLLESLPESFRA